MLNNKKIAVLIPLRGGSKGIPHKNIKIINGKPLCEWSIKAASESKFIDHVYVSTDSTKIKDIVKNLDYDVTVVDRPSAYATDDASTESVMLHFLENNNFDILVTMQATSPLVLFYDLDRALSIFSDKDYNSLFSAYALHQFVWDQNANPINYIPSYRPRRQDHKGVIIENGAFYITSRKILESTKCRLGGNIGFYIMSQLRSYEIDDYDDWELVSYLLSKRNDDVYQK